MLSVGAIHFEDRFCASKKGGIGGGGRVSAQGAVHIAALAGCLANSTTQVEELTAAEAEAKANVGT